MSNAELAPSFSIESVAMALNGIKKGDKYSCLCPAHPDTKPSLSVSLSNSGKILFYCHAGCSQQQVLTALRNRGIMPQAKLTQVKDTIESVYPYTNERGDYLFEKVRFAGKKFLHRKKLDSGAYTYKGVTKDIEIPLYNLVDVLKASTVYIVEGEKDVETLKRHGLVATCNFDGAGKWREHYNQWLAGKDLIVIGDNDDPGRAHVKMLKVRLSKIAKSLRVVDLVTHWPEIKDHGDVTDYLACHKLEDLTQIVISTIPEPLPPESTGKEESSGAKTKKEPVLKIPKARYEDYAKLFEKILGNPKRDIFSDDLLFINEIGFWEKAAGAIGVLRSEAASLEDSFQMKFNLPLIRDHFDKFERSKKPEFLIDVPKWDGKDRIKVFADALVPRKDSILNNEDFDQFISDWLCKAWKRVFDPNVRNRILVLKSEQTKGKDWWTDSLLFGAGQFMKDLSVVTGDKDSYLQLSSGMFLKVAEFEKTAKAEASVLKDMITKPFTDLRAPHDRATKRRYSRCSFIGNANSDDLLKDPTGSSRFIIFELDSFKYNYPVRNLEAGVQILAQARHLAEAGFECSKESEEKLSDYLNNRTPDDPGNIVFRSYESKIMEYLHSSSIDPFVRIESLKQGWVNNEHLRALVKQVAEECEYTENYVRNRLIAKGMGIIKKVRGKTVRGFKLPDTREDIKEDDGPLDPDDINESLDDSDIPF